MLLAIIDIFRHATAAIDGAASMPPKRFFIFFARYYDADYFAIFRRHAAAPLLCFSMLCFFLSRHDDARDAYLFSLLKILFFSYAKNATVFFCCHALRCRRCCHMLSAMLLPLYRSMLPY